MGKEKPARYVLAVPERMEEVFVEASVSFTFGDGWVAGLGRSARGSGRAEGFGKAGGAKVLGGAGGADGVGRIGGIAV